MSSLVRSMLRNSTSREPASADEASRTAGSPRSPFSGMTTVASFNDFSMHVGQDAETDFDEKAASSRRSGSLDVPNTYFSRSSMESQPGASPGANDYNLRAAAAWTPGASAWDPARLLPKSAAIAIPSGANFPQHEHDASSMLPPKASAPGTTTPTRRKKGSGKINGMDYWEFCELIRSSSL